MAIKLNYETVCHKACRVGIIESSEIQAIKLDEEDGLSQTLGFMNGTISVSDYLIENTPNYIIIEASDLEDSIVGAHRTLGELLKIKGAVDLNSLRSTDRRSIRKKMWSPLTEEFKRKWCGSIAVVERKLRLSNQNSVTPLYSYIILCKNKTDPRLLDELVTQLRGMIRNIKVSTTEKLQTHLD